MEKLGGLSSKGVETSRVKKGSKTMVWKCGAEGRKKAEKTGWWRLGNWGRDINKNKRRIGYAYKTAQGA